MLSYEKFEFELCDFSDYFKGFKCYVPFSPCVSVKLIYLKCVFERILDTFWILEMTNSR